MARAKIYFVKGIDYNTATSLLAASHSLLTELDPAQAKPKWDGLDLIMSSGGGDIIPAFALYNDLKGLETDLHTHNAGAIDSAAILPYVAGTRRTASASSGFFFHQLHWTFASKDQLTMGTISDASAWLSTYEGLMAEAVAERTSLKKKQVLDMMRIGTSMDSNTALKHGIVHEIVEHTTPQNVRSWMA